MNDIDIIQNFKYWLSFKSNLSNKDIQNKNYKITFQDITDYLISLKKYEKKKNKEILKIKNILLKEFKMNIKVEVNGENKELRFIGELKPQYANCKSFYGKANILVGEDNVFYLLSYNTVVSMCKNGVVTHFGKWSNTTTRHQKEFEKQFGE